ncbi:MAG: hypothetical protein ACREMD_13380 [Gemmatimonadota bacterium]
MRRAGALAAVLPLLVGLEAVGFLIAAIIHLGVPLPVGFTEPVILPAAIAEALIGLFLAIAGLALVAGGRRAWALAIAAHLFGVAGVLVGMFALVVGAGPSTEANEIYHRVALIVLVAVLALLWTERGRRAAGREPPAPR